MEVCFSWDHIFLVKSYACLWYVSLQFYLNWKIPFIYEGLRPWLTFNFGLMLIVVWITGCCTVMVQTEKGQPHILLFPISSIVFVCLFFLQSSLDLFIAYYLFICLFIHCLRFLKLWVRMMIVRMKNLIMQVQQEGL